MKISVLGAGIIGLYIGSRLKEAGADVTFIGTSTNFDKIQKNGLKINSISKASRSFKPEEVDYEIEPTDLTNVDILILTVKNTQTKDALLKIKKLISENCLILTLQNGLKNAEEISSILPSNKLFEGMVAFNAVERPPFEIYQATSGAVIISKNLPENLLNLFRKCHFTLIITENIEGYKWSKLLLNLNNGINCISGLPLKEEFSDRCFRLILSLSIQEALKITQKKKVKLEKLTGVPNKVLPYILKLPNLLFYFAAKKMINIDSAARSSMYGDFNSGRKTEIDSFNGLVVKEGKRLGIPTPINEKIVQLVHQRQTMSSEEIIKFMNLKA